MGSKGISPKNGFTLIEVMMVIIIIGMLFTMAINLTLNMRKKAFIVSIENDLSKTYKLSLYYYTIDQDGIITLADLKELGYNPSPGITLNVIDGSEENLKITGTHNSIIGVIYQIDMNGVITTQ